MTIGLLFVGVELVFWNKKCRNCDKIMSALKTELLSIYARFIHKECFIANITFSLTFWITLYSFVYSSHLSEIRIPYYTLKSLSTYLSGVRRGWLSITQVLSSTVTRLTNRSFTFWTVCFELTDFSYYCIFFCVRE